MRSEQEIFDDLAGLSSSAGYVHALAMFCYRDNYIRYGGRLKAEDMENVFSRERLIRTEITTLIGLMCKKPIDFSHPGLEGVLGLMQQTEALLQELHRCLAAVMFGDMFGAGAAAQLPADPSLAGPAMREPIFYGGESAYGFQYRDFAEKKYGADDPWLLAQMGSNLLSSEDKPRH